MISHPLVLCVAVAALLRLVAAWHGVGWFATDDLAQAIEQGYLWQWHPEAPMREAIRSPILPWMFAALFRATYALGMDDHENVLHVCYSVLGMLSLLGIGATYRLAAHRFSQAVAQKAAWLHAVYAIMPYISTRALIEVLAIVPLMWGLVALSLAPQRQGRAAGMLGFGAGIGLGLAALVRFQLGILLVVALAWLVWPDRKQNRVPRFCSQGLVLFGFGLSMLCVLLLQTAIDLHMQRGFLGTLRSYVDYNVAYSGAAGTSPWYTYLLQFLLLSLPPFGLVLWPDIVRAARRHALVGVCGVAFVGVHSCIGHKEDRFMFSVLPLFFILVAQALEQAKSWSAPWTWARKGFWAINTAALVVATFSDGHQNITTPLLQIARQKTPQTAAVVGFIPSLIPSFYAGPHTTIVHVASLEALRAQLENDAMFRPQHVLLQHVPDARERVLLEDLPHIRCGPPKLCPGDWVDRILVAVNHHNHRRAPTVLVACQALEKGL